MNDVQAPYGYYFNNVGQLTPNGYKYFPESGLIYRTNLFIKDSRGRKPKLGLVKPYEIKGYYCLWHIGKRFKFHRLAFLLMDTYLPEYQKKGFEVDHINGNITDNRWSNLRIISHRRNATNKKMHREGKTPGVVLDPNGRFRAKICIDRKWHHLGFYDTEEEAGDVYKSKVLELEANGKF